MDNKEWFQELDEQERVYAPEELPGQEANPHAGG